MTRPRRRPARHPAFRFLYAVLLLAAGCSGGQSGGGSQPAPAADGTRVEVVYVDAPTAGAAESDSSGWAGATPPRPASAATADDEVGGADLIPYAADGAFAVQVGTFSEPARARRRVRQLRDLGYPAYTVAHPQGNQVRVRIGYFASRQAAERFGQRFRRDHGGSYWVANRTGGEGTTR